MNKNINFLKSPEYALEVEITVLPNWDDFDKIIDFLLNNYSVKILKKAEGPDARKWTLEKDGKIFELVHDDMWGNSLIARNAESESIVNDIGKDLELKLENSNSL